MLRFGIPYGPRARAAGVVAKFTDLAFEGKALTIAGDGSTTRSFIYVEDLADGIVAALAPEAAGRTYNLSGDEVVTILEIAERVQENVDNCEIVHTPPRPGDFPGKTISNERALEELGWKAETSFKEGVRKYVEWVRGTTRPPDPIPGKQPSLNGNEHAAGALLAGAARFEEREPRSWSSPPTSARATTCRRGSSRPTSKKKSPTPRSRSTTASRRWASCSPRSLRGGSHFTFRWAPWLFDVQYWLITKFAPTRWLAHHLIYLLGARGLLRLIAEHEPDVVVSTYPGSPPCSGCCARTGAWRSRCSRRSPTSPGCATGSTRASTSTTSPTPSRSRKSSSWPGPGSVEWTRPPISREFLMPRTRRDAREALDVPAHARDRPRLRRRLGIGDLEGAIETALSDGDTLVACITGRNEARPRAARAALRRQRAGPRSSASPTR